MRSHLKALSSASLPHCFYGGCCSSAGCEQQKANRLSGKCDLLQAQPCQLWGTEVWPRRCLTSPAASGPNSQLHNTAYPEQCHLLNNRPKTKRKHISEEFAPTVWPHIWNSFDPDAKACMCGILKEKWQIKTSGTTRQITAWRVAFCKCYKKQNKNKTPPEQTSGTSQTQKIPICTSEHQFHDKCLIHGGAWKMLATDTRQLTNTVKKESGSEAQPAVGCQDSLARCYQWWKKVWGFMNTDDAPLTGIAKNNKKNITHRLPCAISEERASLEDPDNKTTFSPHFIVDIGHDDRDILYCCHGFPLAGGLFYL